LQQFGVIIPVFAPSGVSNDQVKVMQPLAEPNVGMVGAPLEEERILYLSAQL